MLTITHECCVFCCFGSAEHAMWGDSGGQRGTICRFRCNVSLPIKEGQV
jgi:hypothetical protein